MFDKITSYAAQRTIKDDLDPLVTCTRNVFFSFFRWNSLFHPRLVELGYFGHSWVFCKDVQPNTSVWKEIIFENMRGAYSDIQFRTISYLNFTHWAFVNLETNVHYTAFYQSFISAWICYKMNTLDILTCHTASISWQWYFAQ